MKVLLLNTYYDKGGAAIASNRLLHSLHDEKLEVEALVNESIFKDKLVHSLSGNKFFAIISKINFIFERLVIFVNNKFSKNNLFQVSIANTGTDISHLKIVQDADILHLNWFQHGFLSLQNVEEIIKSGKPIVWTMHDMWPFTGICHHAYECNHYKVRCGKCLYLNSLKLNDLSNDIWNQKNKIYNSNIHFVAVSNWLKEKAKESSLLKHCDISVIPNAIDTDLFCPKDKKSAREKLNLPVNKKILLMGAAKLNDPVKGFLYLREVLKILPDKDQYLLVLFGNIKKDNTFLNDIAVETLYLGIINDPNKIVDLYAAADLTVAPSLYETFGQTISESMACGTPVVTFNNSGQTDIIDHKINGYLAEYKSVEDFCTGIKWTLNENHNISISESARKKIEDNFSNKKVAEKYMNLYKKLLCNEKDNK